MTRCLIEEPPWDIRGDEGLEFAEPRRATGGAS
jgi:hypothetical protein